LLTETQENNRRGAIRFPIEREVRYRTLSETGGDEEGTGRTINISSSGILFTTSRVLLPGCHMEVIVDWPARGGFGSQSKLIARARVIRSETTRTAVEILWYEIHAPDTNAGHAHGSRWVRALAS
jgi:hypothetical protein